MAGGRQKLVTDVEVNSTDAVRGLDKLGDSADKASVDVEQLARELKKTDKPIKDVGTAADKTGKDTRGAFDEMGDSAIGASSSIGEAFGSGGGAAAGLGSLGEVVESFAGMFGPAGLVVGALGGAAIGAVIGFVDKSSAKLAELKEKANDVFDALIEGKGVLDDAYKEAALKDFITENDDLLSVLRKVAGPGALGAVEEALGGNVVAFGDVRKSITQSRDALLGEKDALEKRLQSGDVLTQAERDRIKVINDQTGKLDKLSGVWSEQSDILGIAYDRQSLMNDAQRDGVSDAMASYDAQIKVTTALYNQADAAKVALENTQRLQDAQNKKQRRDTAPGANNPNAVSFDEKRGIWLLANGKPAAAGGPVTAGTAYTVGEYGKETFIPATNGTIVPNGGAVGGNTVVHMTVVTNDPMRVAQKTAEALRRQKFRAG